MAGIRVYFGNHDKTLIRRQREDDPRAMSTAAKNYVGRTAFPSGHTATGYTTALIDAILAPAYYEQFLQSLGEYGALGYDHSYGSLFGRRH